KPAHQGAHACLAVVSSSACMLSKSRASARTAPPKASRISRATGEMVDSRESGVRREKGPASSAPEVLLARAGSSECPSEAGAGEIQGRLVPDATRGADDKCDGTGRDILAGSQLA